jgi:hypothetical protein
MDLTKVTPVVCQEVRERIRKFFEAPEMTPRVMKIRIKGIETHTDRCFQCYKIYKCKGVNHNIKEREELARRAKLRRAKR